MSFLEMLLIFLLILPFFGSILILSLGLQNRNSGAFLSSVVGFLGLFFVILLYPAIKDGEILSYSVSFLPDYNLNLHLRLDGLSWLFCLLLTSIGLLVSIYARYYMSPLDSKSRFYGYFLAFMGSMIGFVISGNLILMFSFWELTSVLSFFLISYWTSNARARDGARLALILNFFGSLALFFSILLLGYVAESYDIDIVLNSKEKILESPYFLFILLGLILGAFAKSSQYPFHFWLPEAMAAPTPVSAYLHSATMVKAGIFLLSRFWPIFSSTEQWFWILGCSGLITLLLGAYFAMFQKDIKLLLAYSTISHLGLIVTLLSLGSSYACVAAVFHIINHAVFKSSLFMASGIIEHEAGTRDMRQLSGLFKSMPITGSLALIASASMAGVPLLNGFLSKEMFFTEAAQTHNISWLDTITPYIATLASMFSVIYSIRFIHGIFFDGAASDLPKIPHEPIYFMRLPVEFLVFICIIVGIFPNWTVKPLLEVAVISILHGVVPTYNISLWHGLNVALIMSIIALCGGVMLYILTKDFLKYRILYFPFTRFLKGKFLFDLFLHILQKKIAPFLKKRFSTISLQKQLRYIFLLAFFIFFSIFYKNNSSLSEFYHNLFSFLKTKDFDNFYQFENILFLVLWIIGGLCSIGLAWQAKFHRLISIMLLGGAGLISCMTFALLSAPDLALTQFLVEIVTTILLLLGLRWLPQRISSIQLQRPSFFVVQRRFIDLLIAGTAAISITFVSYCLMSNLPPEGISQFFLKNSYILSHGENVVNIMLTDFRAFDTFGESAVLVIVSLTIFALLRRFRPDPESIEQPLIQKIYEDVEKNFSEKIKGISLYNYLLLPSVLVQWLFPFIIAMSLFFLLNGHNMPGGGFAAGISLTIGFIMQYSVMSARWVESHLRILPIRWMAIGLLLILCNGLIGILFKKTFLTSFFTNFSTKILGKTTFSTLFLFDFGIFLIVVGAIILILIALAHQSIRGYRVRSFSPTEKELLLENQLKNPPGLPKQ